MKKEMNNKGFSLVELIIVIAIMAVLMGILAPQYLKYVRQSKVSTDITNAENLATAINTEVASGTTTNIQGVPGAGLGSTATTLNYGSNDNVIVEGSRVVKAPKCKRDATTAWTVTVDGVNGVTKIELNSIEIWPDSSAYN